jgi:hypothetical protein
MLHRLFPWDRGSAPTEPGGPLFNPRRQQGGGRHDRPDLYGAIYVSRAEVSAVAEWLAAFRGQQLTAEDFDRTDGRVLALVGFDDDELGDLADLDEPAELHRRRLRPSRVATHTRLVTQQLAGGLFEEGLAGFGWWSTLEASWPNVTLFAERTIARLRIGGEPRPLTIYDPVLAAAASAVGVQISRPRPPTRARRAARLD